MTLRPFKISNGNSWITRIQTHRGEDLIQKSIKIPHKFWKKLLSHPITAFGYSIGHIPENKTLPNPKFEKHEVIRALDFWIEYFVYQNKCDYILEGTVSTEFELHLEELIRVREAVMKESIDTKYVRQKIRVNESQYHLEQIFTPMTKKQKLDDKLIEFTENVLDTSNSPFSTVDQFCYKIRIMTRKEYEQKNKPYATGQIKYNFSEEFLLNGGNLTELVWRNLQQQAMNQVPVPTGQLRDNIAQGGWTSMDDLAESIRILEQNGGLDGRPQVPLPRESTGPDHLLHSNLHPGIPAINTDIITYENMRLTFLDNMNIPGGSNSFMTVPIGLVNDTTEISMNLIVVSGRDIDRLSSTFSNHRVQIRPNNGRNFLEIDGQEYHTTSVSIRHNPMIPSIRFDNLVIETMNLTNNIMTLDFIQTGNSLVRTNLSITFQNNSSDRDGFLQRMRNSSRSWSLQMLGDNRVNIGGDIYTVLEPLQINMN